MGAIGTSAAIGVSSCSSTLSTFSDNIRLTYDGNVGGETSGVNEVSQIVEGYEAISYTLGVENTGVTDYSQSFVLSFPGTPIPQITLINNILHIGTGLTYGSEATNKYAFHITCTLTKSGYESKVINYDNLHITVLPIPQVQYALDGSN
jgi:hypothetical protein